jgi:hypothetical protein
MIPGINNQLSYQPNAGDKLFNNLKGSKRRLPQELVVKLQEICQRNGFKGNLYHQFGLNAPNGFEIYSKFDRQYNIVSLDYDDNVYVNARGVSPDVMTFLREVFSQLAQSKNKEKIITTKGVNNPDFGYQLPYQPDTLINNFYGQYIFLPYELSRHELIEACQRNDFKYEIDGTYFYIFSKIDGQKNLVVIEKSPIHQNLVVNEKSRIHVSGFAISSDVLPLLKEVSLQLAQPQNLNVRIKNLMDRIKAKFKG